MKNSIEKPVRRKGAMRMADIPPAILKQLNAGEIETVTLVEWLAVDQRQLLSAVARLDAFSGFERELARKAEIAAALGISQRMKAMRAAFQSVLKNHSKRDAAFEVLATHPSDIVRAWAAYAVSQDGSLDLNARLALAQRFAADSHMGVRETAWDSFRAFVAADLARGIKLLKPWVKDRNPNVRRCAVEATRPRGVWCAHITALKEDPSPALPLLEPVRADASDYVRRSVGNWLNDASKSRPDWVCELCARWKKESPVKETEAIVKRALRTIQRGQSKV